MDCQYTNPVNLGTAENPDWEYSEISCEFSELENPLELITNTETEANFYISKTLDYGDVLVITFLILFLVFGILKFLTNFLTTTIIKFQHKK